MINRAFFVIYILTGAIFTLSVGAKEEAYLTKSTIKNSTEFIVQEDWIACYKDRNGTPNDDIVEIFYNGDIIYPQQWEHWAPYTEHKNKFYLWVKYNDTPAVGCFVEATTKNISPVTAEQKQPSSNRASTNSKKPTKTASTESGKSDKSDKPTKSTSIESTPLVNSAATNNTAPPPNSSVNEALKINCVAAGTDGTRRLETYYDKFPSKLPCRVVYYREDGKTQLIAEAKQTPGYCAEKREEFLVKLKGWGWQCK